MTERDDLLLALAADLSVRARELLLADSARLQTNNDRTYEFLAMPRMRNPLRPEYELAREDQTVPKSWFGLKHHETLRALRFHPSGVYNDETLQFGRWIGPDGIIVCNRTKGEHLPGWVLFLAQFRDGSTVRVGPPDAAPGRLEPDVRFEAGGGDLVADYGLALDLVARHMHETGARPIYRFEDPELDMMALRCHWEHLAPLRQGAVRYGIRAGQWVLEKLENAEPMLDEFMQKQARKGEQSVERRASVEYDGIFYTCQSCEKKTRVPFEKLGATGKCGHCHEALETTGYPLDATTSTSLRALIRAAPVPLLIDFWAGWCAPCLVSMPQLVAAAAQSNGKFAIVRVNTHRMLTVSETYRVEALPTMLRIEHGLETGREVGAKQKDAIVEFARR